MIRIVVLEILLLGIVSAQPIINLDNFIKSNGSNMELTINLKTFNNKYIFKAIFTNKSFKLNSLRLYSTQINPNSLNQLFEIEGMNQNTAIFVRSLSKRESICQKMKYCNMVKNLSGQECSLSLNLILYLTSNNLSTHHFDTLKTIKLNVLVNNLQDDRLIFEKDIYEFNVSRDEKFNTSFYIRAFSEKNSDLSRFIRYYIKFNDEIQTNLANVIKINETTGSVSISYAEMNQINKYKYEIYVDAVLYCSSGQKPVRNRTKINLNIFDSLNQPIIRVTNLIESKNLTSQLECIKIQRNELIQSASMAIAQIQVDFTNDEDVVNRLNTFNISINSIEPVNQIKYIDIELKQLVDNIYIVYVKRNSNKQSFLTDLYKMNLRINDVKLEFDIIKSIYLCLSEDTENKDLHENLNLIQFRKNINYVDLQDDSSKFTLSSYNFNSNRTNELNISIEAIFNRKTNDIELKYVNQSGNIDIFIISKPELNENGVQVLQKEFDLILVDTINFANIYQDLINTASKYNKYLHFVSKILVNTVKETVVPNELVKVNSRTNTYDFYLNPNNLEKGSTIGYIPKISDLELDSLLSFDTNVIENYHYRLVENTKCFAINKYDGVVKYTGECSIIQYPFIIDVELVGFSNIVKYATIKIDEINNSTNRFLNQNLHAINVKFDSKPIQSIYTFKLNFDLKKNISILEETIPSHLKLINLIFSSSDSSKKTYIEMDDSYSKIFTIDTRTNAIYLNREFLLNNSSLIIDQCLSLEIAVKEYNYTSALRRKLLNNRLLTLVICFVDEEDYNLKSRAGFLVPTMNKLTGSHEFQLLLRSRSDQISINGFLTLVSFFIVLFVALITAISYLFAKNSKKNQFIQQSNMSSDSLNQLKIRNDSAMNIQNNYDIFYKQDNFCSADALNLVYGKLFDYHFREPKNHSLSYSNREKIVCVNEIFADSNSLNISSIKIDQQHSQDQEVYGINNNLRSPSRISSVTNSECVDELCIQDVSFNSYESLSMPIKWTGQETRLSLFDITQPSIVLNASRIERTVYENDFMKQHLKLNHQIEGWVTDNSNMNCIDGKKLNRDELFSDSEIYSEQNSIASNLFQDESTNECII